MRSVVALSLASTALAWPPHPPYSWEHEWAPSHTSEVKCPASTSSAVPTPAYTSGAAGIKAPSSAGLSNATVGLSKGGNAVCVDGYISVSAQTSKNIKFNYAIPPNETVVTETFLEFITADSPFPKSIMQGQQTEGGVFNIRATYCTPKNNTKPSEVQLLTHGVGFDRSYWDFAPGYSYVDVAAEHGAATFFYDRLGIGGSSKPDPIQVVQAPLEVEIAHSIAQLLRGGSISENKFSKIVGVGHSFGSIISSAITGMYPKDFDATILTGFSVNGTGMPPFLTANNLDIAAQNNAARFGNLNNGYLVADTIISTQYAFFRFPAFDPAVLAAADATKQTVTFGELFTISAVGGPALNYTAPVAVVNGENDLPFCSGNCTYPMNLAAAVGPAVYPNVAASNFAAYLAPGTGHGLNLHYTATAAFEYIQSFLSSHGL